MAPESATAYEGRLRLYMARVGLVVLVLVVAICSSRTQPLVLPLPAVVYEDAQQATVHQWLSVAQYTRALADGQHRPRQQHSAPGELVADTNEDDEDKRLVRSNMHGGTTGLEHWCV
ncbi:hypothetical protein V8C86DRAFT_2879004, partial [Haematococcus lacustris]